MEGEKQIYTGSLPARQADFIKNVEKQIKEQTGENGELSTSNGFSKRGLRAQMPYMVAKEVQFYMQSVQSPFHMTENPDGFLRMLVAENALMFDIVGPKLKSVAANEDLPNHVTKYGQSHGQEGFRKALAKYMTKHWFGSEVDHRRVCIQNGCASVMESLLHLFCDEGDTVIAPGPCHHGLFPNFWVKSNVLIKQAATTIESGFELTVEALDQAYNEAVAGGSRPRCLLLIQPNNPTGHMLTNECLLNCLKWAYSKNIHLISDEVYAISIFEGIQLRSLSKIWFQQIADETNKNDEKYQNFLQNYVHIAGGLGKDFGISGFRIGILYTHNVDLLKVSADKWGSLNCASSHTQYILQKTFEDEKWVDDYVNVFKKRLTMAYKALKSALNAAGIPIHEAQGTLAVWADLRQFLKEPTWEAEEALFEELFTECKWLITRGRHFGSVEPGWMRVMFSDQTFISEDTIEQPFLELQKRLMKWKSERK